MKHFKTILYFFFLFSFANKIYSNSVKELRVEWNAIKGNNGYKIQAQDKSESIILEEIISTNKAELKLNVGEYKIRVSALNKFKKASNWSDWKSVTILDTEEKQELNLNKEKKEPAPAIQKEEISFWKYFIPGFRAFESKQYWKTGAYLAIFTIGSYQIYNDRKRGNELTQKQENSEYYPAIVYSGISNPLGIYSFWAKSQDREVYDQYQNNQRNIGYGLLVTYLFSIFDAYYLTRSEPNLSVELFYNPVDTFHNQESFIFSVRYRF